ncbi:MAG: pilus assembly protein [Hyphomicrobiaceae bacterium]|nr:pilus assembly protein [Hyphomicrobiaceae bacterium]
MRSNIVRHWSSARCWRTIKEALDDRSGVAVIEFALIMPVLIALYFGAVELSDAMTVDRRITAIASTSADLAAQAEELPSGEVGDIFDAASSIMQPYSADDVSIVLTSVVADEENNTTVDWSCSNGDEGAHPLGSAFTLPPNLTQPFTSVIVAEVTYTYNSFLSHFITTPINMEETFYLRPRRSLTVALPDGCGG